LLVGNLAAIPQGNFKRLLAYSSISHAGFLLLALAANSHQAPNTSIHVVSFYLGAYLLMTMLCFAVMVVVGRHVGSDDLGAYDGLGKRSPFLAFALLIGVVSLAGVPLTAGFMGKFLVFSLAVTSGNVVLIVLAIIGAVAGFYYYLKVVRSMYFNAPNEAFPCGELTYSPLTKALIILLIAGTLIAGVIPGLISRLLGH
jgi:NADH-quinone oxidoreductase subunit N